MYQPEFEGLKVTQDAALKRADVACIESVNLPGLSLNPRLLHQGGNGGYQALNLAVLLGAKRVVLLGYDMRKENGRTHWHGNHPDGLNNPYDGLLQGWRANYETTLSDLSRLGVEVVNCSPGSALTCYPMAHIEDAL